ncbi:tyrosine-type recombinase/integrase [Streptomyces smaragdinus]|uniref:tyrosine-type recombinase/integrase n=1 Tax=Streptomyces smaragdinus TaxID=2585196 RepID=UPI002B20076C|nr:tyrosine-type recombinase/integrase [Streptomyces smaragdinus]
MSEREDSTPEPDDTPGVVLDSATGSELALPSADPRQHWPLHARRLYDKLIAIYGEGDALPTVAASWIARQRSANTQKTYARGFTVFEVYIREHGVHPFAVTFMLADTFRLYLETAPTLIRVKGGAKDELAAAGPPLSDASRVNVLSAASSFYDNTLRLDGLPVAKNPFAAVLRPVIDPDYSATEGLTEQQTALLLTTARDTPLPAKYRPRACALMLLLYGLCLRVDSLLAARVEDLGYDRGHHTLDVRLKGGSRKKKPVPLYVYDALMTHLNGRTSGHLFCTASGKPLDEPAVWRLIRSLAKKSRTPAGHLHPPPRYEAQRHHPRPRPPRRPHRQNPVLGRPPGHPHHPALQPPQRTPRRQPQLRTRRQPRSGARNG